MHRPVAPRTDLVASVGYSAGRSVYKLPAGLGVFVDPVTIGFDSRGTDLRAGLEHRLWQRGRTRVVVSGGGGIARTRIKARVQSAVLNVPADLVHSAQLGYAGLRLEHDLPGEGITAYLGGTGTAYSDGKRKAETAMGISFALGR
ncbi:hypothetical protein [Pseudoprimorskyibacter insulae]|nr:hypothetical protein [Pseudoprimorskyibacter insulae]